MTASYLTGWIKVAPDPRSERALRELVGDGAVDLIIANRGKRR